jgi:P-loop containing dynein motor region D4
MRIKKNMQFIIQFTPTGQNFREKMQRNPELILNSQLVWIQNLASESLMVIGKKLFLEAIEIE